MGQKFLSYFFPLSFIPFLFYCIGTLLAVSTKQDVLSYTTLYLFFYFLLVAPYLQSFFSSFGKKQISKNTFLLICLCLLLSIVPLFLLDTASLVLFYLFLFCLYSFYTTPLIFSNRFVLQWIGWIFLIIPGFLGFSQHTHVLPPPQAVAISLLWIIGLSLFYSLVQRNLVFFMKKEYILLLIGALWSYCAYSVTTYHYYFATSFVYPLVPFAIFARKDFTVETAIKYMPLITGVLGLCTIIFLSVRLFF